MVFWEWIKAFFSNGWVIGIGTAIISGIILNFISNKFANSKAEKEVEINVKRVNEEILSFLGKLLAEDIIVSKSIIETAKDSFSRKNDVPLQLIYTNDQIFNDLITEVYRTGFISKDRKERIVKELIQNEEISSDLTDFSTDLASMEKELEKYLNITKRNIRSKYNNILIPLFLVLILALTAVAFSPIQGADRELAEILSVLVLAPFTALSTTFVFKDIFKNKK